MDERNFTFMFYGFAAAWAILALYAGMLAAGDRRLRKEMENLKRLVQSKEK